MYDLQTLKDSGVLDYLYQKGFLAPKAFAYLDYFNSYRSYIKQGFEHKDAISLVSERCRVSEITVWRAIKALSENSLNSPN